MARTLAEQAEAPFRARFVKMSVIAAQVATAILGFMLVSRGDPRAFNAPAAAVGLAALAAAGATALLWRRTERRQAVARMQLVFLGAAAGTLALSAIYAISFYLRIPADLLGFSEGQFVADLIRFRSGGTIYTSPLDNNAYPYMPGTQLLTYTLAALAGFSDSIVAWRVVQYGYVMGAALAAAAAVMELGRHLGSRLSAGWFAVSVAILVLVTGEPRFNLYTHTLHNDGLSLLISMSAFWALARHVRVPGMATSVLLVLLPPAALMVKQNGIIWLPLIALCVVVARPSEWRQVLWRALASTALLGLIVFLGHRQWGGEHFTFWVFGALGAKDVSVFRSVFNLLDAGVYASFFIAAAVVLRAQNAQRPLWSLLLVCVLLFCVNAYTSGIGFVANHLGPGVMLATVWALLVTARLWEQTSHQRLNGWIIVAVCLLIPAGLGLVKYPRDHVPSDLRRYVAAIEAEFDGESRSHVLLDDGNWVYLGDNIVMRDRGAPVSLHLGVNQKEPGHVHLTATIDRIRNAEYRRILVRNFSSGRSLYGFGRPDSPVAAALDQRYQVVRKIAPVRTSVWWPDLLLGEIDVLEPRTDVGSQ